MKLAARIRSSDSQLGAYYLTCWNGIVAILVILAPSYIRFGQPFWNLPPSDAAQSFVVAVAFLGFAAFLRLTAGHRGAIRLASAALAGILCFGAAYLYVALVHDLPHSRAMFLIATALAVSLGPLPFLLHRYRPFVLAALSGMVVLLVASGMMRAPASSQSGPQERILATALHGVLATYHSGLVEPLVSDGGGIEALGDGFLLVTGSADFYRLDWSADGNALRSQHLSLPAPFDREAFLADQENRLTAPRLRVTDLLLDDSAAPTRLFLAHQHWNGADRCFTMRVSALELAGGELAGGDASSREWEAIFEARPCLGVSPSFDDSETGGRLAWDSRGQLLLTLGDHGFDGRLATSLAQQEDADYGKVLLLDGTGGRRIMSLGHRNPQGLLVDREGRTWVTEHGPRGGDELNLIDGVGKNYGWPLATYGTDYGLEYWPLAPEGRNHAEFEEPLLAFVPSVAVSNLIEVGPDQFPRWHGDLLISSLRGQSLFRVRMRENRIVYVEPIPIDREIRDLTESSSGRIALWTDEGDVVSLTRTSARIDGNVLYHRQCAICHEPTPGQSRAVGPSLNGISGRPVASLEQYAYSEALRRLGGAWTPERLDAFLQNPRAFAPGTAMGLGAVDDAAERRALVAFLTAYR